MYEGDLESAESVFSDRLRFSIEIDNVWSMSNAVFWLLVLRRHRGILDGCGEMVRDYEAHVDRHRARGGGQLAKTVAAAAELEREQGRLERALEMAGEAVQQVEGWGMPSEVCFCLYYLMRAQRSAGRPDEALSTMDRADGILKTATVLSVLRAGLDAGRWADPPARAYVERILRAI